VTTAARLHAHGQPLHVEEVELPAPGKDEVRVELAFAGVNPIDRYIAQGRVAPDGPLPRTLGSEASGTVGGRPVLVNGEGLGVGRDGLWAQAAVVPRSTVVDVPDGVELRDAAAMGIAGLTAWNVVAMAATGPDDRVLVLGASGGVGQIAVSLAASLGAEVCGQTGSEEKVDAVRDQGAHRVVVADAAGLADAVADFRPTVVVDPLGDGFTTAALQLLAPRGRHVLLGVSAGAEATVQLQALYRAGITVLGYTGMLLSDDERRTGLAQALQALADGRLRVTVDRALPLTQVDDAFGLLADRAVIGKVLLDLG
jgi:NADPH:quinone reductase